MSIPVSQFISPTPLPHGNHKFVFYICDSIICVLFDDSHSDRCEVIPHCGFDWHFPD